MNSSIFVCALLLAMISPIIMHEPCGALKDVCEKFGKDTVDGVAEKKQADFLACRAKVLGPELESAVKKCKESLPMDTIEGLTKACSDIKGNADKFAENRSCVRKAIGDKGDQLKECSSKPSS